MSADILMATYNGERFLGEQLDSVLRQADASTHIYVRDDASKDRTPEILRDYERLMPGGMTILSDRNHTGSPGRNFFSLLRYSDADYTMYCDQDDTWATDRMRTMLDAMRRAEKAHPEAPILVHSDLMVVDENLRPVASSFMRYQRLEPRYRTLPRLMVQNNVTGCTVIFNRALRDLLRAPKGDGDIIHDWWTALTAAAFGFIEYVDRPTVYYRQHGTNAIGASDVRSLSYALKRVLRPETVQGALSGTYVAADTFLRTYADLLAPEQTQFLTDYRALASANLSDRIRTLFRYRAFKKGTLRALAQIVLG